MRFPPLALLAKAVRALVPDPIVPEDFFDDAFWARVCRGQGTFEAQTSSPAAPARPADRGG